MEPKRAQEIRSRLEAINGFKIVSKEVRSIRTPLTEEQKAVVAGEMAAHVLEANKIEEEKKLVTKQLKDKMDEQNAQAASLAEVYEKGYEDVESDVFVVADIPGKIRRIFSIKTGLQVDQEVLQDRDLQEELKLKPAAAKSAAEPAKEPAEGEAGMAKEGEIIIMANPERIALGYEGKGGEDGALESADGMVVTEADYEVLADETAAPEIEKETIVTQIRSVETKDKVTFITTAENVVLYTDAAVDIAIAKANIQENKAGAERGDAFFVKLTFIKSDTRNQQLYSITKQEVPQTGTDEEPFETKSISEHVDIEEGDDPDGEDPAPKDHSEDDGEQF